jgi:hypothetical protein
MLRLVKTTKGMLTRKRVRGREKACSGRSVIVAVGQNNKRHVNEKKVC